MINFSVFGVPVPQGRPRFARVGNFVKTYDPAKSASWKDRIAYAAGEYMRENKKSLITEAIKAEFIFVLPRPKSLPKKQIHHIKKPDFDNLVKAVMDGLRGICYGDDRQIMDAHIIKRYPLPVEVEKELVGVRIRLENA